MTGLDIFITNNVRNTGPFSLTQSYMSGVVSCLNDAECLVTLPIPLSAQDPEHFNIKKAIIESPIVQAIYKFMDLNETMNAWYRVRASLAKPATQWYSATATIANGKHFTTFDGQTYSLEGNDLINIFPSSILASPRQQ